MTATARNGLLFLVVAGIAAGCGLIAAFGSGDGRPGFNHAAHGEDSEAGLSCTDCHTTVADEDAPGMPPLEGCAMCHEEEPEEDGPPSIGAITERYFVDGKLKASQFSKLDDEVIFSHLKHVEAEIDCSTCHMGIEESTSLDGSVAMTMAACGACHEVGREANKCAMCHERIGIDSPPDNHMQMWMKVHGSASRAPEPTTAEDCAMCHEESSCRSCHQTMEPESHDNFFRHHSHGLYANMDRESCATCHRSDSCDACHQDTAPTSHRGSFAGGLNTHCAGCHVPVQDSGCATCHRGGGTHPTAAPIPPGHSSNWDCRTCHGIAPAMPHIDNGDDCTYCHR